MATKAQIRANRENAQKSTGPRTPDGKDASSRNGLTHGLCAEKLLLTGHDPDGFPALLQDLQTRFRPAGESEEKLVLRIAATQWRLDCALPLEAQIYRRRFRELAPAHAPDPAPEADLMGRAFLLDSKDSNAFTKLARYEASLERSIDRCVRQLEKFQKARAQNANRTQFGPPDETAATSDSFLSADKIVRPTLPSYTQEPTETLNIAIAGPAPALHSQLIVNREAQLDGNLNLTLLDGFVPAIDQTFTIVKAATVTGRFQKVMGLDFRPDRRFQIDYPGHAVTLTVKRL